MVLLFLFFGVLACVCRERRGLETDHFTKRKEKKRKYIGFCVQFRKHLVLVVTVTTATPTPDKPSGR